MRSKFDFRRVFYNLLQVLLIFAKSTPRYVAFSNMKGFIFLFISRILIFISLFQFAPVILKVLGFIA